MKYFGFIVYGLACFSLCFNVYQSQTFSNYQKIINNKDALISNGYDEMIINYLKEIKESNNEAIRNQGRVEGILAVIHNYKPEENQYTAIWHSGYYSGLDQKEYQTNIDHQKITVDKK